MPVQTSNWSVNDRPISEAQSDMGASLQLGSAVPELEVGGDDRARVLSFSSTPLRPQADISNGGVVIVRDVTGRHEVEQLKDKMLREMEQKNQQLELASRHKSEFIASMSHELRTPLNAIIGFSEALAENLFGELNEKQADYIHDILDSGRHLLSLINDILDLSKIEAGRMELHVDKFSLAEALSNGLAVIRERASRRGMSLSLRVEPAAETIEADERKIKQVIFNLLSNAVKFTPDGGRVDVVARLVDGRVLVAVRDTGIGIALKDRERIFEDFQQGSAGTEVADEGTGLGLPLARKFVELHGGSLWVESQLGVGSTFKCTLPA
jgi:signal transduction histidine kinase